MKGDVFFLWLIVGWEGYATIHLGGLIPTHP